jgi:integrase
VRETDILLLGRFEWKRTICTVFGSGPSIGLSFRLREGDNYLGSPKTRKSLRGISATESVMRLLADLRAGRADSDFVFSGHCNGFIDPDMFDAEIWRPIVEHAGLTDTRFHDLRHFFASQLIANGETAAYVRDQMGHSSIHVTFDTYGHLFPGRGKEASERYEKSMEVARRKAETSVSNPLANSDVGSRKPEANN